MFGREVLKNDIVSTPVGRHPEQPFDFRPPGHREPPSWWDGPRCGECVGGGGFANANIVHQWWKDLAHDDDPFVVQLVCEDTIVGSGVRRIERCEVNMKNTILNPLQLQRLSGLTKKAAELLGE